MAQVSLFSYKRRHFDETNWGWQLPGGASGDVLGRVFRFLGT